MEPKVSYKEIVRLTFSGGYSQREIAAAAGCSAGTVSNVQRKLRVVGLDAPTAEGMSEKELRGLLAEQRGRKPDVSYVQPDHAAIQEQLDKHRGLTIAIVWEEYAAECVAAGKTPASTASSPPTARRPRSPTAGASAWRSTSWPRCSTTAPYTAAATRAALDAAGPFV